MMHHVWRAVWAAGLGLVFLATGATGEEPRSAKAALAASDDGGLAVGVHAGTLGWGPDLVLGVNSAINLRFSFSQFSHTYSSDLDDIEYDIDLKLRNAGAFLDLHPGSGAFRLTLGALYNGNDLSGIATPTDRISLGDVDFPPEMVGPLHAKLNFPGVAWYAGIGFGNPVTKDSRLTVMLDLGVMFYAEPDLDLSAPDSPINDQDYFKAALSAEEKDIQDQFGQFMRFHPVIALGLSLRFY